MWLNRPNPVLSMLFIAFIGALTIFVSGFWISVAQPRHQCRDTITLVKGRLETAACDADQGIAYMQDLMGERYVICRCRVGHVSLDEEEELSRPETPGFLFEPPTDQSIPRVETGDDKGMVL